MAVEAAHVLVGVVPTVGTRRRRLHATARPLVEHCPRHADEDKPPQPEAGEGARARDANAAALIATEEAGGGIGLEALLFRPVQRMCVYPLLFKQAFKYTDKKSDMNARFEQALNSVQATIADVNETVRKLSEQQRTADVVLSELGGEAQRHLLEQAARTLETEAMVDMKVASGKVKLLAAEWRLRRFVPSA